MSTLPSPGPAIAPVPVEPAPPRGGCARGALIGCSAAILLVLGVFGAFLFYARRRPEAFTDVMMRQVERHLAPDVTAAEKERLRAAYAAWRPRLAARERDVARGPLDRLRRVLSSPSSEVSRDSVRELTEAFERAARPPAAPGSPTPAPAFSPTP